MGGFDLHTNLALRRGFIEIQRPDQPMDVEIPLVVGSGYYSPPVELLVVILSNQVENSIQTWESSIQCWLLQKGYLKFSMDYQHVIYWIEWQFGHYTLISDTIMPFCGIAHSTVWWLKTPNFKPGMEDYGTSHRLICYAHRFVLVSAWNRHGVKMKSTQLCTWVGLPVHTWDNACKTKHMIGPIIGHFSFGSAVVQTPKCFIYPSG